MKQKVKMLLICLSISCACLRTKAQSFEIQQLLLDCEKLTQLKDIYSDMKKGYEILSEGYNAVKDISEGNFDLHKLFLDDLLKASPAIQQYQKVADIINCELQIMSEYDKAYSRFKQDDNFSADEIIYIGKVYSKLIDESLSGLSDLTTVITDGVLRASDDERFNQIDKLDAEMKDRLHFLRYFNNNTSILSLQRARERSDANTVKGIYGLNK